MYRYNVHLCKTYQKFNSLHTYRFMTEQYTLIIVYYINLKRAILCTIHVLQNTTVYSNKQQETVLQDIYILSPLHVLL